MRHAKVTLGGLILAIALLAGCDQIHDLLTPSPEKVLTAYFDALKTQDWDAAYAHISAKDHSVKSLADYRAGAKATGNDFIHIYGSWLT